MDVEALPASVSFRFVSILDLCVCVSVIGKCQYTYYCCVFVLLFICAACASSCTSCNTNGGGLCDTGMCLPGFVLTNGKTCQGNYVQILSYLVCIHLSYLRTDIAGIDQASLFHLILI